MSRNLDVFLASSKVGTLVQDDSGDLSFAYFTEWLDCENAKPLSVSLPLRQEPFTRKECRPFFAGLLPEETGRTLVAQHFGVSDKNDFALLAKIGAECAGAVSLLEEGIEPLNSTTRYRSISTAELAEKMAQLPSRPLLVGESGVRLSLAGAQGKLRSRCRRESFPAAFSRGRTRKARSDDSGWKN